MEAGSSPSGRLQLKPYQKQCLEAAKEHNLLAVLPTNSGKTLVAASLAEHYLSTQLASASSTGVEQWQERAQGCKKKVVFLAPTTALVEQQAQVLANHLGAVRWDSAPDEDDLRQPRLRMHHGKLTGREGAESWDEDSDSSGGQRGGNFWRSAEVFVLTPHFLISSLVHGLVKMCDLCLLVLDEAHHTQGRDHYSNLMKHFYRRCDDDQRPRVLGLTASPFKGSAQKPGELRKDLDELEDLLDCTAWTSTDCCPPAAEPRFEPFTGEGSSSSAAASLLKVSEEVLQSSPEAADGELAKKLLRQLKDIVLGQDPLMQAMGAWAGAEMLRLVCGDEKRGWSLLGDEDEQPGKTGRGAWAAAWSVRCKKLLQGTKGFGEGEDKSPSLQALLSLLQKRNGPELKALVFVQTRLRALLVHRFLEQDPALRGTTQPVVSSNQRTAGLLRFGTTNSKQRTVLQSFRSDQQAGGPQVFRVLVATPVLEEGIDVPNCSLVVRFDPPKTPIENIQSRGRARHSQSEYVHLMSTGSSSHSHRTLLDDFARYEADLRDLLGSTVAGFEARARHRAQQPHPREDKTEVFHVESTGAMLPMELAMDIMRRIYVHHGPAEAGDTMNAIHFTEPHFCLKEKAHKSSNLTVEKTESGAWCGSLRLPHLGGCSVPLSSDLVVQGKELPKELARQSAALAGVRKLHEIGVLDDHLRVVGRRESLEKLRQATSTLTQSRGTTRSDDHVAEQHMDDLIMQLPPCLQEPRGPELYLHRVQGCTSEETGPDLGLLLPGSIGKPLPFMLLPRGRPAECKLISTRQVKLSTAELAEVAHWTACALELSTVHKMLAQWAVLHKGSKQVPRLRHREGDYVAAAPANVVNSTSRSERAWFAVVPLERDGSIDWDFLKRGLLQMERAEFPLLVQETGRPSTGAAGDPRHERLSGLPANLDLTQAMLLSPSQHDSRQHLYSRAVCLVDSAEHPTLNAEHITRRMDNAASALQDREHGKDMQQLLSEHCRCLPLSLSQFLLLRHLPSIVWRVAHLAVARELLEKEHGLCGASLQHVAEALTHRAAHAPGVERPESCHYEILEFLGDAVLKCLACTWAFARLPQAAEGQLSKEAQRLQTNHFLCRCLRQHEWHRAFLAKAFSPKVSLETLRTQMVSHKQQADVVEALLGASFLQGRGASEDSHSIDAAVVFVRCHLLPHLKGDDSLSMEGVQLDRCAGYAALLGLGSTSTQVCCRTFEDYLVDPGLLGGETEYQRLEFLGDAVLQLLVSQYLVQTFPKSSEGELSELRSSLVCNDHLARKLVRRLSPCFGVESDAFDRLFPQGLRVQARAFAERLALQKVDADFVVGRGLGLASSALSATAEGAVDVMEAPKCIADVYEAIVGALLLDSGANLAHVWSVISPDLQIKAHEAESGLRRREEVLRQMASVACCRPTVSPDPDPERRKEAAQQARLKWPEKVERQRCEVESRRVQELNDAKRQGATGPVLEATLQRNPLFAKLDVRQWLQEQGSKPGSPSPLPSAIPTPNRAAAAPRLNLDSAPSPLVETVSEVAQLPGRHSGLFVGILQQQRRAGEVSATLTIQVSADDSKALCGRGPDVGQAYAEIRKAVFTHLGLPEVRLQAERQDFHGMLRAILTSTGPKGLADFGNLPAVAEARKVFDVPAKRKLKELLLERPETFELRGEGNGAIVQLRQP